MKPLLLLVALGIPTTTLAQQGTPAPASQQQEKLIPVVFSFPSGWVVAQPSYLYRTLRDARLGHYAHRVRTGDLLVDVNNASNARWLRVTRFHASDTTVYYLPGAAINYKGGAPHRWALH